MTDIEYMAIDAERLDAMRGRGTDEFGNPWQRRVAAGWEPLRCCLRTAAAGEDITLISYSPWPLPWTTPWAEAGPVFVCFRSCPGYPTPAVYPPDLSRSYSLLSPFGQDGARAYQHITFVDPGADHDAAIRTVMAQPGVAYLHVRSAVAQCFTFAVRPYESSSRGAAPVLGERGAAPVLGERLAVAGLLEGQHGGGRGCGCRRDQQQAD